jgi:hypothetical protein
MGDVEGKGIGEGAGEGAGAAVPATVIRTLALREQTEFIQSSTAKSVV